MRPLLPGLTLLFLAGLAIGGACTSTTGSSGTACVAIGAPCHDSSDCCGNAANPYAAECSSGTCQPCSDGIIVYQCQCDGVTVAGDCSSGQGQPCGPDGGTVGISDGGAEDGGVGDGGAAPVCQCVGMVEETPCP